MPCHARNYPATYGSKSHFAKQNNTEKNNNNNNNNNNSLRYIWICSKDLYQIWFVPTFRVSSWAWAGDLNFVRSISSKEIFIKSFTFFPHSLGVKVCTTTLLIISPAQRSSDLLPISWIIFICGTNTTHVGTMCHFEVNRSKIKVTRIVRIFFLGRSAPIYNF